MLKVGLIVNPISRMGESVGLKGIDGDVYKFQNFFHSAAHSTLTMIGYG